MEVTQRHKYLAPDEQACITLSEVTLVNFSHAIHYGDRFLLTTCSYLPSSLQSKDFLSLSDYLSIYDTVYGLDSHIEDDHLWPIQHTTRYPRVVR